MRALVKSGHLEKFNDRQYILLDKNVNVDFFDELEQHTTNLISQIAEVDERTNFMTAIGDVIVVSDSGVTLYTDTLMWNSEEELIYTDDPIMLTTEKNDTLYGIGFESDVSMDHWKILQPSGVTERAKDE
jgi:LPS export ABC transporter protein LptC